MPACRPAFDSDPGLDPEPSCPACFGEGLDTDGDVCALCAAVVDFDAAGDVCALCAAVVDFDAADLEPAEVA